MKFLNFFNYRLSNLNINDLFCKIIEDEKDNNTKIINCMNPHSFVISKKDEKFQDALSHAYLNLIDGVGISIYLTLKKMIKINRITGYDLFEKIISSKEPKKFFFLGSTESNLLKIKSRLNQENKNCLIETYSPPFVEKFSNEENEKIISKINLFNPDYLFVGMTAPKQEKWSFENKDKLHVKFIFNIGAVFDYYAGNFLRPYKIIRNIGLEWLFRVIQNPRLINRTLISFPKYSLYIFKDIFSRSPKFEIQIIDNIDILNNKINNDELYIFSAFNLAMTSNLASNKLKNKDDFTYWSDGIFCKFFNRKIKKIAGNVLLENIHLNQKFKQIHVIGNLHDQDKKFLNQKFKLLDVTFTSLPFGVPEDLIKKIKSIDKNSLILLTLSTPKQELLAQKIKSKFNFGKIICIGGGLSIASGYEKKCPVIFEKIGLEFLWRLRSETKRRTLRILKDLIIIFFSLITFRLTKFKISKYEKE
ncbi:WecB/TagA/CpsF family glycosyltransferase [Candidatus Pelagibacter sp.]|uniref:WecB/TagA/CpsF family glycosyltransferase n=1 Tax=Candidatus Pelagibacter sp. TaxID=2024849 RepID=UPI003D100FB6